MLRRAIIAYGLLALVVAVVLAATVHATLGIAIYLAVNGALVTGGLLLERGRYQPRIDQARGHWQLTGERFVDPTTGRLMAVRYNPDTGERDYVAASAEQESRELE